MIKEPARVSKERGLAPEQTSATVSGATGQ